LYSRLPSFDLLNFFFLFHLSEERFFIFVFSFLFLYLSLNVLLFLII
jgi:hypothetical protein